MEVAGDWAVRVVPNLYPAFQRQEVVVHSPRHVRSFAELSDGEVELVAEAWRRRAEAVGDSYVHALVNEGRVAGASLAHSHSQLLWLAEPPPEVRAEERGGCGVCEILTSANVLSEEEEVLVAVHPAGRVPYELLIAPRSHGGNAFAGRALGIALRRLSSAIRGLRAIEGPLPWNAWLHHGPHWHIEVFPRLTVLAGVELGAGIYVNTLAPEEAASRLRSAVA